MKSIVYIGLAAILGGIVADGYGTINHHRHRGPPRHHTPPGPYRPHGHHNPPDSDGHKDSPRLDGQLPDGWQHYNPPHHRISPKKEFYRSASFDSSESGELDRGSDSGPDSSTDSRPYSGLDSEPDKRQDSGPDEGWYSGPDDDDSSYDWSSEENWHDFGRRRPCRGWRCPAPKTPTTKKPSRTRPSTKAWLLTMPSRGWLTSRPGTTVSTKTTRPSTSGSHTPMPTHGPGTPSTPSISTKPTPNTGSPNTISTQNTTHASSPNTNPTTDSSPEMTTIPEAVSECIGNCIPTPEYNPVCGTDGSTYDNIGRLLCTKMCGMNVDLRRRSVCPPPVSYPDDGEDTSGGGSPPRPSGRSDGGDTDEGPTTPPMTVPPIIGRTTSITDLHRCMKQCRMNPNFRPVCGTDSVTYLNIDRLYCAKECGEDVQVLCEKPCGACGEEMRTTMPTPITTPRPNVQTTSSMPSVLTTTIGNIARTTPTPTMERCIQSCPVTSEYNPVCGSNDVTYINAGHLLCAQYCGDDVKVALLGPCSMRLTTGSSIMTTSPSTPTIDDYDYYGEPTLAPDVLACMRRCPVTAEYNPVCGTNGITYTSPGRLECAKYCGINVELRHEKTCFDPPETTISPSSTAGASIEGNKDITFTQSWTSPVTSSGTSSSTPTSMSTSSSTPTSMSTSSSTSNSMSNSTSPPTPSSTTTSLSTSSQTPYTSPTIIGSSSSLDYTIPTDILFSIFGDGTNTSSTQPTKLTTADEDNIDPRFGEVTEEKTDRNEYESRIIFPE